MTKKLATVLEKPHRQLATHKQLAQSVKTFPRMPSPERLKKNLDRSLTIRSVKQWTARPSMVNLPLWLKKNQKDHLKPNLRTLETKSNASKVNLSMMELESNFNTLALRQTSLT